MQNKQLKMNKRATTNHDTEPEEEYIDLKLILDSLYIDTNSFLKPIKSVRIAGCGE